MKYKGYELLKAIADGEIKKGSKVIAPNDIQYTYNGMLFKDENKNFMNEEFSDREYAMLDFELIEDETDIQNVEEYETTYTERCIDKEVRDKINELIRALKQLDRKVEKIQI